MKKAMSCFLGLLFMILSLCDSSAADKTNKPIIKTVDNYIAVFDFEVTTGDKGISRPLADKVIHEFSLSDKYEVIDRGNMNKILKEQKFQMTGCVAQECKVEAGQILGVGKIVNGSVGMVGKTYYLTLQLIDVKTGKVELSAEDACKCEVDELLGSTKRLAKKLLGEEAEKPESATPKPTPVAEAKVRAEAEERAKAEAAAKAKAEAIAKAEEIERAKAKAEAIARAKAEEAERVKAAQIAEARAEAEAKAKAKAEAEARARAEEAERIKAEQIAKARAEEIERLKAEIAKTKAAVEAKAKVEAAEKIKAEHIAKAKENESKIKIAAIEQSVVSSKIAASDDRFEKLANGIVRDTKSGLEWYAGPDKNTDWDDATSLVANLRIDGGGWRMPTIKELKSLYQKGTGSRNMTPLLETTGRLVWSGETAAGGLPITGSNGVWALDFDYGSETWCNRSDSSYKRGFSVRSRKGY